MERDGVIVRVAWNVPDAWTGDIRTKVMKRVTEAMMDAAERIAPGVTAWSTADADPLSRGPGRRPR